MPAVVIRVRGHSVILRAVGTTALKRATGRRRWGPLLPNGPPSGVDLDALVVTSDGVDGGTIEVEVGDTRIVVRGRVDTEALAGVLAAWRADDDPAAGGEELRVHAPVPRPAGERAPPLDLYRMLAAELGLRPGPRAQIVTDIKQALTAAIVLHIESTRQAVTPPPKPCFDRDSRSRA